MITAEDLELPEIDPTVNQKYEEYCARRGKIIDKKTDEYMLDIGLYHKDKNGNPVCDKQLREMIRERIARELPFMVGYEEEE